MPNVWVVRADSGKYINHFLDGGYAGIGWNDLGDLSQMSGREELERKYRQIYPNDTNNVVGAQVGQIERFLLKIEAGDFVITPSGNPEWLFWGIVTHQPYYFEANSEDDRRYFHRRSVQWTLEPVRRSEFSIPLQNTLRSSLTVFGVSPPEEFLRKINVVPPPPQTYTDPYDVVLNQILTLDPQEFEILVGHLLAAAGFEETEVTGRPGDGGVDVKGVLNASNLGKVTVFVQVKRYQPNNLVSRSVVRQLRQAIPFGEQGAFVTTSGFRSGAAEIAEEAGFPRIGLINGRKVVDLLTQYWDNIPPDFQETLGLRKGLVPV